MTIEAKLCQIQNSGQIFLLVDLREFFFSNLGSGGRQKIKIKSSENDPLTGHFQSFFFRTFFLISPEKNSKTSEANQQSVFNLYIFHHFPKNLDRTITFNSVTLKNTQTEPQQNIIF